MKVLLSAYACEPGRGSEPEVGFRAMLAAAAQHEVWVLTRENNLPSLASFLAGHPLEGKIHLVGLDVHGYPLKIKKALGRVGLHWYYDLWQRRAAHRAAELDAEVGFDLAHHVTFASYWTHAGVASFDGPFVWGPVGGGVETPVGLIPELGLRGAAEELVRSAIRRIAALSPRVRRAAGRATVVLVQNGETARRIRTSSPIRVVSNATSVASNVALGKGERSAAVVVVGRLVPWKAPVLALRAFRYVRHHEATLTFFGAGPDSGRVERLARRWGLGDRVELAGRVPRQDLLDRVATAGVLLHPSLHDEAGLAIAEALTLGTPVVSLDWGGPAVLAGKWDEGAAVTVSPTTPRRTAAALAAAIDRCLQSPPPVASSRLLPQESFEEEILAAYERAATMRNDPG